MPVTIRRVIASVDDESRNLHTRSLRLFTTVKGVFPWPKERVDLLGQRMMSTLRKLGGLRYRLHRLRAVVGEELARQVDPATIGLLTHADESTGAEHEFEDLLLRAKSSLDILVRMLDPAAGIELRSFGDKGDSVVAALRNNIGGQAKTRGEEFAAWVEGYSEWMEKWIDWRDDVAHKRPLESSGFVRKNVDNQMTVTEPKGPDGVPFREYADDLFRKIVDFSEVFIAKTYDLALPDVVRLVEVPDWSPEKGEADRFRIET